MESKGAKDVDDDAPKGGGAKGGDADSKGGGGGGFELDTVCDDWKDFPIYKGQSLSKEVMLNDDLELVQRHCERGAEDNRRGLSAFNDAWVQQMQTLRFEAGVAPDRPDGSNDFLAALSAAMHERCPDVW